jgi:hypothetical protein
MGMFDTIKFSRAIQCKECGFEHKTTQTKQFENLMVVFEVGDHLPGRMITGIVEESLYCEHLALEGKIKPSFDQIVYLVIYRNILIGVVETYEIAEKQINKFGFGELFLLYQDLHKKRDSFQGKYNRLASWCRRYAEYLNMGAEEKEEIENEKGLKSIRYGSLFPFVKKSEPLKEYIKQLDEQKDISKYDLFY